MPTLAQKIDIARKLGWGWAVWRAGYEFRKKSGLLKRRLPTPAWSDVHLAKVLSPGVPTDPFAYRNSRAGSAARFFFPAGELPARDLLTGLVPQSHRDRAIAVADDYCAGRFLYYSKLVFDLGLPPDWIKSPLAQMRHNNQAHWCDLSAFSAEMGDIKDVWEPSRFACAYWLARTYAFTADEKYPTAFWKLFESWCEQNPPNRGPNWRCGQETSFRIMAWCFALYAFWNSPATTPARVASMVCALALSAGRVAPNIDYAVSQKNNHAISEALGLFTVGTLFPELRGAAGWAAEGRRIAEREILRQVYDDGSYVQQSMNYHRVMLHDALWVSRLAELNGKPLAKLVLNRIARAAEFLFEMLDQPSGRVPNYGANDGALVLPLSSNDYRDFRDTVQAANYSHSRTRVVEAGPWDETLLWLFGESALHSPLSRKQPSSKRFNSGGYYTIRTPRSWAMVRCHTYRDRPGHVDMLHVDLWHDGQNILRDSGSYRYFAPKEPGAETYFKDIAAHNTIQVGDTGPLELVSRFIWLPWPRASCLRHEKNKFVGEHHAYNRSPWHVRHRRTVEALEDGTKWLIHDQLLGSMRQLVTLRWHLAPGTYEVNSMNRTVNLDVGSSHAQIVISAPTEMTMELKNSDGQSEYYAERSTAPVLEVSGVVGLPVELMTTLTLSTNQSRSVTVT
jgi:hypothetical protein